MPINRIRPDDRRAEDRLRAARRSSTGTVFKGAVHFLKAIFVWLLWLAPGLLIIWYGLGGVTNEKLADASVRSNWTSYGDDAVSGGWVFIGVGLWGMGEMSYGKTHRIVFRIVGWILAIIASGIGCWVLVR